MLMFESVREEYLDFAAYAEGESPCFTEWARSVADDPDVLAWLAELPDLKRQPNLVFAAARWHGVPAPGAYAGLREALLGAQSAEVRATVLARRTQTNEVGRLATLLPALDRVATASGEALALVEVGASAGLCLYPDRWDYRWIRAAGHVSALGDGHDGAVLDCQVTGPFRAPTAHPKIAWRAGLDLSPLSPADADAMAWLRTLVWPEQQGRRDRLAQAIDIAAADPPVLTQGDVIDDLPGVLEQAGEHGLPVVFHSAVLAYLPHERRREFEAMMTALVAAGRCHWVTNEGKSVHPDITRTGPPVPDDLATFVLGLDGQALAWTHGHGASMTWL